MPRTCSSRGIGSTAARWILDLDRDPQDATRFYVEKHPESQRYWSLADQAGEPSLDAARDVFSAVLFARPTTGAAAVQGRRISAGLVLQDSRISSDSKRRAQPTHAGAGHCERVVPTLRSVSLSHTAVDESPARKKKMGTTVATSISRDPSGVELVSSLCSR